MTAPSATARSTPGGFPLRDGHSTKITLGADSDIEFWEKTVQPPGIDGGDEVAATTMHNTTWRVFRPGTLKTLTECTATVAYDPELFDELKMVAAINREDTITITFPDTSTVAFYGFVKSFTPQSHEDSQQPEAELVIVPTNWDATAGSEEGPAVVSYGTS